MTIKQTQRLTENCKVKNHKNVKHDTAQSQTQKNHNCQTQVNCRAK